jgi:hypothetical protein
MWWYYLPGRGTVISAVARIFPSSARIHQGRISISAVMQPMRKVGRDCQCDLPHSDPVFGAQGLLLSSGFNRVARNFLVLWRGVTLRSTLKAH